jgi:hypothetical protein
MTILYKYSVKQQTEAVVVVKAIIFEMNISEF